MPREPKNERKQSFMPLEVRLSGHAYEQARKEFGDRVRVRMNQKNWNQSQLAEKAGNTRAGISSYIRGKAFPAPKHLAALAKALGCPPEELIPEATQASVDVPTVAMRQEGDLMHLQINKRVSLSVATRILAILQEEDGVRAGTALAS